MLIDALQDPLAVVAQDRELLEVSDAFCALVGLRREELVGARPPYPHWHPDRSAEMSAVLDARLAVGRSEDVVTFWHRDEGREVHVTVTRAPLHDDAGDLVGHVVAMQDVTARVEAERVAARRTAELRGVRGDGADRGWRRSSASIAAGSRSTPRSSSSRRGRSRRRSASMRRRSACATSTRASSA